MIHEGDNKNVIVLITQAVIIAGVKNNVIF